MERTSLTSLGSVSGSGATGPLDKAAGQQAPSQPRASAPGKLDRIALAFKWAWANTFGDLKEYESAAKQYYSGRMVENLRTGDFMSFAENSAKLRRIIAGDRAEWPVLIADKDAKRTKEEKRTLARVAKGRTVSPEALDREVQQALREQIRTTLSPGQLKEITARAPLEFRQFKLISLHNFFEAAIAESREPESSFHALEGSLTDRLGELKKDVRIFNHVDQKGARTGLAKQLGSGAKNKVYLVNDGQQNWVFKPFRAESHSRGGWDPGFASGIDPENPNLLSRAVAVDEVAKELGFDCCVQTKWAVVNGQPGIVMDLAAGGAPETINETKETQLTTGSSHAIERDLADRINNGEKFSSKQLKSYAGLLGAKELRVRQGKLYRVDNELRHFPKENPNLARTLNDLQLLDIITGQVDRHPENYYVDDQGQVRAIDNDLSFGKKLRALAFRTFERLGFLPNRGCLLVNPPPVMDHVQAEKILHLKEERLEEILGPHLTPEEIDAAKERLRNLQSHVMGLYGQGKVYLDTQTWMEWRESDDGFKSEYADKLSRLQDQNPKEPDRRIFRDRDELWSHAAKYDLVNRDSSYFARENQVLRQKYDIQSDGEKKKKTFYSWNHLRAAS